MIKIGYVKPSETAGIITWFIHFYVDNKVFVIRLLGLYFVWRWKMEEV